VSRRTDRVGDLLRHELAALIQREIADPRVRLTSVSAVEVSPDLAHARISISVLGDEEAARLRSVEALQHASGFLRRRLAARLRLRAVPQLTFALDRGAEHSQRIATILENLHVDQDA